MDITPTNITLVLAVIGAVVWLVRLESKANTTSDDLDELYQKTDQHVLDRTIHHDGDDLNRRFGDIGRELSEIKGGIQGLNSRIDNFLKK